MLVDHVDELREVAIDVLRHFFNTTASFTCEFLI